MVPRLEDRGEEASWRDLYDPGLPGQITSEHSDVLSMFKSSVERASERAQVIYFDSAISVGDVDALSDAFAVALAERGVGAGDRVGLYLQNVPQFVISLLAVWKLHAVGVPCNPMLRERELVRQLNDCGAIALVALESLYERLGRAAVDQTPVKTTVTTSEHDFLDGPPPAILPERTRLSPHEEVEDLARLLHGYAGQAPEPVSIGPEDVALLTYTSGTTGPPKGAMNTHDNVVYLPGLPRLASHRRPGRHSRHSASLPHHRAHRSYRPRPVPADSSGPRLSLRRRGDAVASSSDTERRSTVAAITAFLALLRDDALPRHDLSSLTKAYSGGATIPPAVVDEFERRTGIVIRSAYGLTETTSPTHLTPLGRRTPTDTETGALAVGAPGLQHEHADSGRAWRAPTDRARRRGPAQRAAGRAGILEQP